MKNKKLYLLILLMAFTFTVLAAGSFNKDDPKGKSLFIKKYECNECHSVKLDKIAATTKSDNMKGPDLSGYSTDHSLADLATYARKEADLDGKKHLKPFKGTDEELQAIIDWLGTLE